MKENSRAWDGASLVRRGPNKGRVDALERSGFGVMYVLDRFGLLDLVFCSVTDEDGLASPFDDDVLAFGDGGQIDFNLGLSQHIGGRGHVDQEVCGEKNRQLFRALIVAG